MNLFVISVLCFFALGAPSSLKAEEVKAWCYEPKEIKTLTNFFPCSPIVLEGRNYPLLEAIADRPNIVLATFSLDTIGEKLPYLQEKVAASLLRQEGGRFYYKITDPNWQKVLIEELLPHTLLRHFDGIAVKDLSSVWGNDPAGKEAVIRLVKAMDFQYPEMKIALIDNYPVIEELASHVDYVIVTGLESTDKDAAKTRLEVLRKMRKNHPKLPILSLDFAKEGDQKEVQRIEDVQNSRGFIPFVYQSGN